MAAGRCADAVPVCKELVAAMPGNNGLLLNLGLAQHMAGLEKDAVPTFEAVLKAEPRKMPALLSLAAARLALEQPALAVPVLNRALAVEPKNSEARGMLADALTSLGKFDEAAEQYRKLTELNPNDPRTWYGLGMAYQTMATDAFEQLQKAGADSAYVAALIGDTRVQRRQYRSAFYFYSEALKKAPELHGVRAALAEVYRKTGHADWAVHEDAAERSLPAADCKAHPGECQFLGGHDLQATALPSGAKPTPEAWFWRAKAANELALQALIRLGQLPQSAEVHQVRAQIARDQGQHLESAKEWRAAMALTPGNPGLQYELASSLFLAGDFKSAIEEAEKVLKRNPRSPEMNFTVGDSWLRLEEPEKAVPYLRAALALAPDMHAADASLGLSLSRVGKFAEAVQHLEKALDLDEDGSLHYQLSRAYQASGETAKAKAALTAYQELLRKDQQRKEEAAKEAQIVAPR
jgi:tetratricopeptide (TPR) repeat protein